MLWATVILFLLLSLGPSLAAKPASNNPANNNNNINDNNNADEANKVPPCTVVNTANKAFYDLSSLSRPIIDKSLVKPASWNARGFDYGYNFTLGVCASPLSVASSQKNANNIYNSPNDIDSSIKNASLVGGYYTGHDGIKYSIGNFNSTPVFRGKKLLLTYTNGSYCKDPHAKPGSDGYLTDAFGKKLRKSTILSFTCDKEIMAKASVSFIGVLNDCDYFFEVRTAHACITPKKADDLAAIWIFMFMYVCYCYCFLFLLLFCTITNYFFLFLVCLLHYRSILVADSFTRLSSSAEKGGTNFQLLTT